jgi:hypothetical protein
MAARLDGLKARRILGGFTVTELARRSNTSDAIVTQLEAIGSSGRAEGGTVNEDIAQRLLDAIAPPVALATNTQASPTVFTVTAGHGFQTGDTVVIAGNVGSNADPNGTRVVTRINATTFSVPVNCAAAGGTGGTATATLASVGIARL